LSFCMRYSIFCILSSPLTLPFQVSIITRFISPEARATPWKTYRTIRITGTSTSTRSE